MMIFAKYGMKTAWLSLVATCVVTVAVVFSTQTAVAQQPRGTITGLTLTSGEPRVLVITWDEVDPAPTAYEVVWAKADGRSSPFTQDTENAFTTVSTLTLADLDPGSNYEVRVRARYSNDATGLPDAYGPWSEIARLTVAAEPESIAGNEQIQPLGNKSHPPAYEKLDYSLNELVRESAKLPVVARQSLARASDKSEPLAIVIVVVEDGRSKEVLAFLEAGGSTAYILEDDETYIIAHVPISILPSLSEREDVIYVKHDSPPRSNGGPGATAHGANAWNSDGYEGQGVKIGVLDTGFSSYSSNIDKGLPNPAGFYCVFQESGVPSDDESLQNCEAISGLRTHGTDVIAMAYDVAPQATYYIAIATGSFSVGNTLKWFISQGVDIITTSVVYAWDGPGDGTSPYPFGPTRSVDKAVESGIVYTISAGNEGTDAWFGEFDDADNDNVLDFSPGDECNNISLFAFTSYTIAVRWEDKWNGAGTDLDIYLHTTGDNPVIVEKSEHRQSGSPGHDPLEEIGFSTPLGGHFCLSVEKKSGSTPDWVHLLITGRPFRMEHHASGYSLGGSPAGTVSQGALTVGAADYRYTNKIASYSSRGPLPDGTIKPDIVGAASVPGVTTSQMLTGTSFSTPHVAGLAALVKQRYPNYTPSEIANYLKENALGRGTVPNNTWGYGFAHLPANPASGEPVISGFPAVGEILTADTSSIKDKDGTSGVSFIYQWSRVEDGEITDIVGATERKYTVASSDLGKSLRLSVSFTDEGGNPELLASASTTMVAPVPLTLLSNIGQSGTTSSLSLGRDTTIIQQFQTGPSLRGYLLRKIQIDVQKRSPSYLEYTVSIYTSDADDRADTLVATLEGNLESTGVQDFVPSAPVLLQPNTKYIASIVIDSESRPTIGYAGAVKTIDSAPEESARGWEMADNAIYRTRSTRPWTTHANRLALKIVGAPIPADNTVSFGQTSYSVTEGESTTIAVRLQKAPEGNLVIPISVTYEGGASETDVSGSFGAAEFRSDETEDLLTIRAVQNFEDDDGKSFDLKFGMLPEGYDVGEHPSTTVTIIDDELPFVTVEFEQATYSVLEGESAEITVIVSEPPQRELIVPLSFQHEGQADGSHHDAIPQSIIFGSAETRRSFTFTATRDPGLAERKSVRLSLVNPPERTIVGPVHESIITIVDPLQIQARGRPEIMGVLQVGEELSLNTSDISDENGLSNAEYSYQWVRVDATGEFDIPEATEATYTLSALDEGRSIRARVAFKDDEGYAEEPSSNISVVVASKYAAVTGNTLVSNSDQVSSLHAVSFAGSVPIRAQSFATGSHTKGYTLSGVAINLAERTGMTPRLSIYSDSSGGVGSLLKGLSNPGPIGSDIGDTYHFSAGDYHLQPDTTYWLVLERSTGTGNCDLLVTENTDDDTGAALGWRMGNGSLLFARSAWETVPDISLQMAFVGQASGNAPASGSPTITGTTDVGQTLTVDLIGISDDDGLDNPTYAYQWIRVENGADIEISDATSSTYTLVLEDGNKPIKVRVSFADAADNEEMLTSPATKAVTPPGLTFTPGSITIDENSTSAYTIELNTQPSGTVVVTIDAPVDNSDVTTDVAKLTFDVLTWNTTQTVMVTAAADADPEDETATLTHSASSETDNNYEGLSAEDLEVTVNDNAPDVRVSFLQDRYIVSEGASLTLTVEISADPERTIVVPIISINQAKASGSDYSVLSTPVTFTAGGQLQQSFILTATDDRSVDAGESVKFMFGALPTKVSAGVSKETTVFITDNDVAGVTIDPIDLNVREGSENTYFVELDTQPTGNVVITINDPVDNSDVTVNPASLTFDGMNWNSPQPVTVTAGKDSDAEDDTATITHSVSSNRDIDYSMLLAQDVNVRVADNAAEVQVSFTQDSHIVAEGDDVFVAIVIDKDPGRLIRLRILLTYQNGASEFDLYQADTRTYFFRSGGSQEKGKFFYSGEDTVVDPGEFVQITFRDLPAKVSTGRFASTRVTIVDNDGTQSSQPHLSFLGVTTPSGKEISFDKYFHPEETFYIASVPNSVTRIKVTASPFDDNATIEYLDGSNASLVVAATSDPDTVEIDLEEGKTIFKVKVTAEDATTVLIYTVSMNREASVDTTEPILQTAVADGNTITLTYSEALDANSIPAAAAFSVVVDGTAASLGSNPITVVGTVVTLTLMTAVTPGDTVTVSYAKPTGPTASPIRDEAGNLAADLSDEAVTNNTMTAPGALATFTAVAGSQQVVLSWTPPAQTGGSAITKYQYRVSADGVSWSPDWTDVPDGSDSGTDLHDEASYTVGSLQNGTTYTFQLRAVNAIGDGDLSETTATPAAAPNLPLSLDAVTGDDVVNIEEKAGGFNITGDTGSVDAASVVVVIGSSGNLTTTSDSNGMWSLSVPANAMYISGGSVTITVNATKTGYTAAAQVTGNITIDLSAPTLDSAVADGNTITLTYSEALDADSIPAAAAFSVVVDGTAASLGSNPITVVGTVVTLTLMTAATPGDTVTVSYAKPTGPTASPIRDEAGNLAADLSDQVVTNNTMTAPGTLAAFTAVAGSQQVVLSWTPPAQTGGSAITKYQYRVSADGVSWSPDWTDVPDGDSDSELFDERSLTVSSLNNGTTYTFQLRAVNAIGDGDPSETTATPVSPKTSDLLARDDEASTRHDIQVTIPVLTNDRSSNRDSLEVASVTQPTNGTVSRTSAAHLVKYTPKQGFAGTDNFTYTVSDGQETSTAKVQVTVQSSEIRGDENQKWVASPSTTRVAEGEITTIRFENTKENAAIPEGQLLIATLQIGRLEGTVDQADFQVEDNEGNVLQGREIKDPTIHHNGGWIYLVMWSSGSMANEFRIRTIPNEDSGSGDEYLVYWAYVHGLLVGSEVITIEPAQ